MMQLIASSLISSDKNLTELKSGVEIGEASRMMELLRVQIKKEEVSFGFESTICFKKDSIGYRFFSKSGIRLYRKEVKRYECS